MRQSVSVSESPCFPSPATLPELLCVDMRVNPLFSHVLVFLTSSGFSSKSRHSPTLMATSWTWLFSGTALQSPGSHKIHTSHCLTTAFLLFQVPRLFTFNFLVLHLGPPARRPSSLSCTICCSYLSPRFSFCRSHCSSLRQLFNFNAAVLKLPYITDDITDDTIYHISYITYITD